MKSAGQVAFEAYSESRNGIAFNGEPIPQWNALSGEVAAGWEAAAKAVKAANRKPENLAWRDTLLDERQRKEVQLSEVYAKDFNHGTAGHNQFLLVAKLAELLDDAYEPKTSGSTEAKAKR